MPSSLDLDSIAISHRESSKTDRVSIDVLPSGLSAHVPGDGPDIDDTPKRGKIYGFSAKSRSRLRKMLMHVDFDDISAAGKRARRAKGYFVTLTYPGVYPSDWHEWKRHLDRFHKRLARLPWFVWSIWRIERQKRGAPHYHIVVVFERDVCRDLFASWVMESWHDCIESDDAAHRWIGTDTRTLYNPKHSKLMSYMLKYLSKVQGSDEKWCAGRIWGVWGEMPDTIIARMEFVTPGSWCEFCRRVRRWGKNSRYLKRRTVSQGFDLVGRGLDLVQLLSGLNVVVTTNERMT